MPLTHMLATRLAQRLAAVRKSGECPWARPDGKTQVGRLIGGKAALRLVKQGFPKCQWPVRCTAAGTWR